MICENRLVGKTAIVTGAAGSIGRATVERLVAEGAAVVAVDRVPLGYAGEGIVEARADLLQDGAVESFVRQALDRFGRLDIMVNNAGTEGPIAPVGDYDADAFDLLWKVNVRGTFLGIALASKVMTEQGGGSIVNLASITGVGSARHQIGYGATKHAVVGMTRTAALELAPYRVRVNAVAPASVATPMMERVELGFHARRPDAVRSSITEQIPLGRYAEPAEVAGLIAYLASDEAAFVTGSVYPIDGGWGVR